MNPELIEDTQRFLRDLKWFLIHIGLYLAFNLVLAIFVFTDLKSNWWLLFPMISWAIGLIFHAIQLADKKKRGRMRALLSTFLTVR